MSVGSPHLRDWTPSQHGYLPNSWWAAEEVRSLSHAQKNCLRAMFQLLRKEKGTQKWEGYQSYAQIAAMAGASRRTAIRAAKVLTERGIVAKRTRIRDFGDQGANRFRLLPPPSVRTSEDHLHIETLLDDWAKPEHSGRSRFAVLEAQRAQKQMPEPEDGPALELVRDFHQRMRGRIATVYRPFPKELALAQEILGFGDRADEVYKYALSRLGSWKPDVFGGLARYVVEARELLRLEAEAEARALEAARAWEAGREAREAAEQAEEAARARRAAEELQRQKEREELERLAAALAAREALAALPGLVQRLAAYEGQVAGLGPVQDRTADGRPIPAFRVVTARMLRLGMDERLSALRDLASRIEAGTGNTAMIAQLEAGLDSIAGMIARA